MNKVTVYATAAVALLLWGPSLFRLGQRLGRLARMVNVGRKARVVILARDPVTKERVMLVDPARLILDVGAGPVEMTRVDLGVPPPSGALLKPYAGETIH